MKIRTKSALLLVATLLVGVLTGAMGTSALHNKRLKEIRDLGNRGGLTSWVEDVIGPVDETQRVELRAVLERSEARFDEARHRCRGFYVASKDSMLTELVPLLTPAQQTRLDEWLARDRERRDRRGSERRSSDHPRSTR